MVGCNLFTFPNNRYLTLKEPVKAVMKSLSPVSSSSKLPVAFTNTRMLSCGSTPISAALALPDTRDIALLFEEAPAPLPDVFTHRINGTQYMLLDEVLEYLQYDSFEDLVKKISATAIDEGIIESRTEGIENFKSFYRNMTYKKGLLPAKHGCRADLSNRVRLVHYSASLMQVMDIQQVTVC